MPRWSRALAALLLVVTGALVTSPAAAGGGPPSRPPRPPLADHVVLVGFDGFDADYVGRAPTPNLDALVRRGAWGTTLAPAQSVTNPSFASLVTGAWPDRTGNVAYVLDRATRTAQGQSRHLAVPTIAEAVRAAGGTVASAQYFILQDHGTAYGDPEALYTQPGGGCSRRFDDAIAVLEGRPVRSGTTTVTTPRPPQLLAVYCDTLDSIGHDGGAESPLIDAALVDLDAQIGRLVAALQRVGIADRTAIVVSGDHGMTTATRAFGPELVSQLEARGLTARYSVPGIPAGPEAEVILTTAGGAANAYLVGDLWGDRRALRLVREAAAATEGTAAVLDRHAQRRLHMDPRVGDLVIEAEAGWSADGWVIDPPNGRHGSQAERRAALIVGGAGVRALPRWWPVHLRHIDVAPTIAHLLGIAPPSGSQGRVRLDVVRAR